MIQTFPSVCPLDCADTCSMTVTVEDDQIVKVRGSQVNPLTRGAICGKVSHYPELCTVPTGSVRLYSVLAQGRGPLYAHLVGRGPRSHLYPFHGDHAGIWRRRPSCRSTTPGRTASWLVGRWICVSSISLAPHAWPVVPCVAGSKSEAFVGTYGAVPLMRPEHVAAGATDYCLGQ